MSNSNSATSFSSSSESTLLQASLTWTIDNFSYRDTGLRSQHFSDEKKNDFDLCLFPNEKGFIYLSIFVHNEKLKIKYKLSLINSHGQKHLLSDNTGSVSPANESRDYVRINIPKFISRAALLKPSNGYLPGDKLTLHCEIVHLDNKKITFNAVPSQSDTMAKVIGTLRNDYVNLLKSGHLADMDLIVGGKTIRAHKLILATRSPVFAAMFTHDTKEKKENRVEIPDVGLEAFEALLEFLYTGAMPTLDNVKSVEELLITADKYACGQLKGICEDYLISQMTIETAPNLLLFANSVNADKLKEKLLQFIRSRGIELFSAMENEPEQMINMFQYLAVKNDDKKESK